MIENDPLFFQILISGITSLNFSQKTILWKKLDSSTVDDVPLIEEISSFVHQNARKNVTWDADAHVKTAMKGRMLMERLGIKSVLYSDADYPKLLLETENPPFMLFYRGNISLLKGRCVSVVGTRKVTARGIEASRSFAYDAASDGVTVVSGLAFGVDINAHKGALNACIDGKTDVCRTVCVLPGGVDAIVPGGHKSVAAKILSGGGCILSEYVPGIPPEKWRFVQRNRIVAGISEATVVIEAPPGSGAMITADMALNYNREVMFHRAAFSEAAMTISKMVQLNLSVKKGCEAQKKIQRAPIQFVNDGAAIVDNYSDYCACLAEMPGMRSSKLVEQGLLF